MTPKAAAHGAQRAQSQVVRKGQDGDRTPPPDHDERMELHRMSARATKAAVQRRQKKK